MSTKKGIIMSEMDPKLVLKQCGYLRIHEEHDFDSGPSMMTLQRFHCRGLRQDVNHIITPPGVNYVTLVTRDGIISVPDDDPRIDMVNNINEVMEIVNDLKARIEVLEDLEKFRSEKG